MKWLMTRGTEGRYDKSFHFIALIPEHSLEALKACIFKPHCGLGQAIIKPVGKGDREVNGITSGDGGVAVLTMADSGSLPIAPRRS